MATPKHILQSLLDPKLSGRVFINTAFGQDPIYTPLKGFYRRADGILYFYGEDRLGFSFNAHYDRLFVQDFLGRYRRCILRTEEEFILFITVNKQKGNLFALYLEADEVLPGDLYDQGCVIVHSYPDKNLVQVYADEQLMPYTIEMAHEDAKRFCYTLIRASE